MVLMAEFLNEALKNFYGDMQTQIPSGILDFLILIKTW